MPFMNRPDAILFDLDGTLVDAQEAIVDSVLDLAEKEGLEIPTRQWLTDRIGTSPTETWRLMGSSRPEVLSKTFSGLYGQDIQERTILLPGVIKTLEALQQADILLALVTLRLTEDGQQALDQFDLHPFIQVVIGRDATPRPKPAPDSLLLAAQRLGVSSSNTLMVGDTAADMEASVAAGIGAIGVLGGVGKENTLREAGADFILTGGIEDILGLLTLHPS
ncbi:MAG: HAD family hydrolase [Planctomycetota bacterium]|nr:HAD family hydrolase [Planctomycetota bacterium]